MKQVFFTQKGGNLYAITAGWPGEELTLHDIDVSKKETEVTLLGHDQPLAWARKGDRVIIETPDFGPGEAPSEHAFVFRLTAIESARD